MQISANAQQLAEQVHAAHKRIAGKIAKTPCLPSREISGLHLKAENFQHTGSFKLRGATSKLTMLDRTTPVITASSGNHGIACSHAAQQTGHELTVVLPENVAKSKLAKIRSYGTKTILHPGDSGMAEQEARRLATEGYEYVSPYNDPLVMAGQGTAGLEMLEQVDKIDNIFISMGGGGLISGIAAVVKSASPGTKIIGVSATNSAALAASIKAGHTVQTEHLETLADGCAGGIDDGAITLPLATELIDDLVYCSEAQIEQALRHMAWSENMLVEGAAAMAVVPLLDDKSPYAGQSNIVVLCGGNFDTERLRPIICG